MVKVLQARLGLQIYSRLPYPATPSTFLQLQRPYLQMLHLTSSLLKKKKKTPIVYTIITVYV